MNEEVIASEPAARDAALGRLLEAVIRGSLRPLARQAVIAQAELLLRDGWTDVTRRELEGALDALSLADVEVDHVGRFFAAEMAGSLDAVVANLRAAVEAVGELEDTEGSDCEALRYQQMAPIFHAPLLDAREEYLLGLRATRFAEARNRLVEANTRLARAVSGVRRAHSTPALDEDDLFQEACLGLLRAAVKFDPTRGFKFSTYATWWLRQAVSRAIADKSRTIRVPVHVHDRLGRIQAARRRVEASGGALSSAGAIAAATGLEASQVRELESVEALECVPLDELTPSVEAQLVARESGSLEDHVIERFMIRSIDGMLAALSDRERAIVTMRMGLDGEPSTLDSIGVAFGITRERVRQIETQAFDRLRSLAEVVQLRQKAA